MDTLVIVSENLADIQTLLSQPEELSFWSQYGTSIIGLIEVLLLGAYVYFTKSTFDQIKKQTDLQLKAYLGIDDKLLTEKDFVQLNIVMDCLDSDFGNDWKDIMKNSFPDFGEDVFSGKYYSLEFSNHGNVDIKKFTIESSITINNSENIVKEKKLIPKETKLFKSELTRYLKKGETIHIPLFSTSIFPKFDITSKVKFEDARGEKYDEVKIEFGDTNSHLL